VDELLGPVVFQLGVGHFMYVRLNREDVPGGMAVLRQTWGELNPGQEFEYAFLDDCFAGFYREEERWGRIVTLAGGVAVLTACLGLFGIALLAANRRTKEIGIRKVLGATVPGIVALLSKEFAYLVLAANLMAWPVAYLTMQRWLERFAYRIELGPGVFVLGGLLALGIAWLTVSWHAVRAALANPVEALRYE
jgi:putative ABC transport system permease protein